MVDIIYQNILSGLSDILLIDAPNFIGRIDRKEEFVKKHEPDKNCLEVRRAECNDIRSIYRIGRKAYPEFVRYQVPFAFQKDWLAYIVNNTSAEVYVVLLNGELVGYTIMVLNLREYAKEKGIRKPHYLIRLLTLLSSPKAFIFTIGQKMDRLIAAISDNEQNISVKAEKLNSNSIVISQFAVSKHYQGKRLGKVMLNFLEKRAFELNRNKISLAVPRKK